MFNFLRSLGLDPIEANKNPSVRKKALFWLGQTGSEEAVKLFEEILLKKD